MSGGEVDFWTPSDLFEGLSRRYGPFDIDVAASKHNAKCVNFYTKEIDALNPGIEWKGRVWCNPPYNNIGPWVAKSIQQVRERNAERVVMLLPAGTCTKWFQLAYEHAARIEFVHGRLNFKGPHALDDGKAAAPNPSIVVVFDCNYQFKKHLVNPLLPPAQGPDFQVINRKGTILWGRQSSLNEWL